MCLVVGMPYMDIQDHMETRDKDTPAHVRAKQ